VERLGLAGNVLGECHAALLIHVRGVLLTSQSLAVNVLVKTHNKRVLAGGPGCSTIFATPLPPAPPHTPPQENSRPQSSIQPALYVYTAFLPVSYMQFCSPMLNGG
jgi:hypothetical protein